MKVYADVDLTAENFDEIVNSLVDCLGDRPEKAFGIIETIDKLVNQRRVTYEYDHWYLTGDDDIALVGSQYDEMDKCDPSIVYYVLISDLLDKYDAWYAKQRQELHEFKEKEKKKQEAIDAQRRKRETDKKMRDEQEEKEQYVKLAAKFLHKSEQQIRDELSLHKRGVTEGCYSG